MNIYDQIKIIKRIEKPTYGYSEWIDDHKLDGEPNDSLLKLYEAIDNIHFEADGEVQGLHIKYLNKLIRVIIDNADLIYEIAILVKSELREKNEQTEQQLKEEDNQPW